MSLPEELKTGLYRILDEYRGRLHSNFYSTIEDLSFLVLFKSHKTTNFISVVGGQDWVRERGSNFLPRQSVNWDEFKNLQPREQFRFYEEVLLPGFNYLLGEEDFRKHISRHYDRSDVILFFSATHIIDSIDVNGWESEILRF